jgi:hypothetical protein
MRLAEKILRNGNKFVVEGRLTRIGNQAPYFSLTYSEYEGGRMVAGGTNHKEILKHFPRFANLAALHLSDIDGTPMHTLENGCYHLGLGKFSELNYDFAKKHFRCTDAEFTQLLHDIEQVRSDTTLPNYPKDGNLAEARATVAAFVEKMRPIWQSEARAVIAYYELK